jgi:hypothetical protein
VAATWFGRLDGGTASGVVRKDEYLTANRTAGGDPKDEHRSNWTIGMDWTRRWVHSEGRSARRERFGSSSKYPSPTGSSSKFFSSSSKSSLDYGQLVSSNNSAAVAWELLVQGVYGSSSYPCLTIIQSLDNDICNV